jgi:hypothetical protein
MENGHDIGPRPEHPGEYRRLARRIVAALDLGALRVHDHQVVGGHHSRMAPGGAAHFARVEQQVAGLGYARPAQSRVIHQPFHVKQPTGSRQLFAKFLRSLHWMRPIVNGKW